MLPRPPPKISLYVTIGLAEKFHWAPKLINNQKEKLFDSHKEKLVARQAKFFQTTQPIPNPIRDRSGQLGVTQDVIGVQDERKTSRSQGISVNSLNEELCSSDSSWQLDITQDVIGVQTYPSEENKNVGVEQTRDRSEQLDKHNDAVQEDPEEYHEAETLNTDNETIRDRIEEDIDFKIPGLHHSFVKHAQRASVRELIQKIENHSIRHALQQDLRQNQSFNPFSPESKTNDS